MLARAHVIVKISPTRLELAVAHGQVVQQRRVERYNPPAPGADYADTLRARHATLAGWVTELGLGGAQTTLLFWSPTAVAALPSCAAHLGSAAAQRAAVLSLAESAGYAIADNPTSSAALFTDSAPHAKAGQAQPQKLTYTLAAVETEANCALVSQWVASCGLNPVRILPCSAPVITHLVSRCAKAQPPAGEAGIVKATLWIGDHESFFIVGDRRSLWLFRPLSVGVENLVEALLRPITPRGTDGTPGEPVTIDRAAARSLLDKAGIPQPADLIDERAGFTGASVLPLMNPVLQRFSVEIKQSLRFGLTDAQRGAVRVTVAGPGAALPRIAEAVAQFCQVTVEPVADVPPVSERCSAVNGTIRALLDTPCPATGLMPASMQEAKVRTRARRALWSGVAVSAAMVALSAGWFWVELGAAQQKADSLRTQAEAADKADLALKTASAKASAAKQAQAYVAKAVGPAPDLAAMLALLGQATDRRTSLESIDLKETETGWTCRLSGLMQAGDDKSFADAVKAYTDGLAASPLVTGVKLGAASRTKVGDADAHRFDLTLELVEVPFGAVDQPTASTARVEVNTNPGGTR